MSLYIDKADRDDCRKAKPPKGVPNTAKLVRLHSLDWLQMLNGLLKPHGLRIRTKASGRGGGLPSWVWVEATSTPPIVPVKPPDWEGLNKHLADMGLPSK